MPVTRDQLQELDRIAAQRREALRRMEEQVHLRVERPMYYLDPDTPREVAFTEAQVPEGWDRIPTAGLPPLRTAAQRILDAQAQLGIARDPLGPRQIHHDLSMMYKDTFVRVDIPDRKSIPVYIMDFGNTDPVTVMLYPLDTKVPVRYEASEVKFLKDQPELGLLGTPKGVMFCSQGIDRQFKRGYSVSNVRCSCVFGAKTSAVDTLNILFKDRELFKMDEAIQRVRKGSKGVLINRELAVGQYRDWDAPFISWNDNYVGWVEEAMIVMKEFDWLLPKMKDHIEIQDVV